MNCNGKKHHCIAITVHYILVICATFKHLTFVHIQSFGMAPNFYIMAL